MSQNSNELHTIDELAHLSGMPSRTIRFYNTQGMLPPPIMRGRVAYYNQEHLLVLTIIKELKGQQQLPLESIKQLLEVRARHGDVQMNLALKQRLLRPLTSSAQEVQLSKKVLMQQSGASEARIDELVGQGLLFPTEAGEDGEPLFTGDDILLLQLYERLEDLGFPIALPALIRFHLRQLVRSELAAFAQHVQLRWQEEGLSAEQQAEQFEAILTLTDTLISVLHRKMVYSL
ncbi:MAG TPA: MerR family transcriptional regulator [Ktedonobacteraceae bacterium]|jgi:DNA-binding transcriptional MerR regulator|nr:MerR family transcriptional regulator [Ktedonobacteraceae bacterium]